MSEKRRFTGSDAGIINYLASLNGNESEDDAEDDEVDDRDDENIQYYKDREELQQVLEADSDTEVQQNEMDEHLAGDPPLLEADTDDSERRQPGQSASTSTSHARRQVLRVLSASAVSAGNVGSGALLSEIALGAVEMVQEGEGVAPGDAGLIAPRRLPNPCLESPQRMDLHRELLFNQRIGKNVLNQKSELEKALSKHKEKQILNQVREHRETPELERAIAERARRLEQAEQVTEEPDGTNPTLQEVRARLRHAAPAPAASAH